MVKGTSSQIYVVILLPTDTFRNLTNLSPTVIDQDFE